MKRYVVIILIAVGLILLGGVLAGCSLMSMGGFQGVSALVTSQETITGDFSNIDLDIQEANVTFLPSPDGTCYYKTTVHEKLPCSAKVENGTLKITQINNKKWYHYIEIFHSEPSLELYLPQTAYEQLTVVCRTSDVKISEDFSFENVTITASTGDLDLACQVSGQMALCLSTGDVSVQGVSALTEESFDSLTVSVSTGDVNIQDLSVGSISVSTGTGACRIQTTSVTDTLSVTSSTGKKVLAAVTCGSLYMKATTGDTELNSVIVSGDAELESGTGDWDLHCFDAANITITATTGEVKGTILTDKIFFVDTSTGKVDVPKCTAGGICNIITSTGDVEIQISPIDTQ